MRNAPSALVLSGTNMNADISSAWLDVRNMWGCSFQVTCTTGGTLGGVFKLQVATDRIVDQAGNATRAGTVRDLASPAPITITGAGTFGLDTTYPIPFPFVRLFYAKSGSDTGTITAAYAFVKGF